VSFPVFDLTPQQLILRFVALLFIAAVHGVTVAGTAVALGDAGPRHDGRLSLNPFTHLDLLGSISAVLFSVGWIKPISIDPGELGPGRIGLVLIVVAAAATTMLSVLALRLVRPMLLPLLPDTASALAFALIETTMQLGLWLVLINLMPLPCLTGGHLLTAIAPHWRDAVWRSRTVVAALLALLAAPGWITHLLAPAYQMLARAILGE
jgi:Zn-dependent protease